MVHHEFRTAVIIGAGNVAWHLAHELTNAGVRILQVAGRNLGPCKSLAAEVKAEYTLRLTYLIPIADVYIIAVSDDALPGVIREADFGDNLVVHTAGSVFIDVFKAYANNFGVLYPLQTLTRGRKVNFKEVPVLIEANTSENLQRVRQLADLLSDKVIETNSDKRKIIHLAGVIASNFSNHMYTLAERLVEKENISFDLLKPLINETNAKALSMSPDRAQTGPAIRGNNNIIRQHLALLEKYPEIAAVYKVISDSILQTGEEMKERQSEKMTK